MTDVAPDQDLAESIDESIQCEGYQLNESRHECDKPATIVMNFHGCAVVLRCLECTHVVLHHFDSFTLGTCAMCGKHFAPVRSIVHVSPL